MIKEEFDAWRHGPAGKWFFDTYLRERLRELEEFVSSGSCQGIDPGTVAMNYMDQVGVIKGVKLVIEAEPFSED